MKAILLSLGILLSGALSVTAGEEMTGSITLVSENEPGVPMQITGTIYAGDGKTPLPGVTIYVYQTDISGTYGKGGRENPHIHATMVSREEGSYGFNTVKPGAYPSGGVPAHVHFEFSWEGKEVAQQTLIFEGDPHINKGIRERAETRRGYALIALEEGEDGILIGICDFTIPVDAPEDGRGP